MKVVTWNMNYWQQAEMSDFAWKFLIEKINPDIALLQETVVPDEYKNEHFIFAKAYGKCDWGTCIYVKNGFDIVDKTTEYFTENKPEYAGKQIVGEIYANGKSLTAVSLHTNTNGDTMNHIEYIFGNEVLRKKNNLVIGGDFNADKSMALSKSFFDNLSSESSSLLECTPEFTQTYFNWNTSEDTHYQDDHIFISKDLKVKKHINKSGQQFNAFTWNYGKVKRYSDHTVLEINLDL